MRRASRGGGGASPGSLLDLPREAMRHALYELCVTEPQRLCRFIEAAHGRRPLVLREDFSGSAAVARWWAASGAGRRAVAVDRDRGVLSAARSAGVLTRAMDVMRCRDRADVISATNFPLGYFHGRDGLVAYLRRARGCLKPGGIFLCDTYGGRDAFTPLKLVALLRGPAGELVEHTWEQRRADPISGRVVDALHFRVSLRGRRAAVLRDAFVYDWRLWSIPELRDAMDAAGFGAVDTHATLGEAVDERGRLRLRPERDGESLPESYVVYLVARR